ncbi:hypothetical protein FNV43_RR26644 [Rhamnella rubrinervis]|uniref:Protein kinase domain-containing protein n=1 Tax=Rhamnella rubrinervis TaxID=2594499 RepID=A0A8K0GPE8_9ROSA|nr:hypothetical protein FNV43_RR26644 [Rhamnella rubrinervis]
MASVSLLFTIFILTHLVLLYTAEEDPRHEICPPFHCKVLGSIGFPFYNISQQDQDHCDGAYAVDFREPYHPKIRLKEGGHWYNVTRISQADSIFINDTELQNEVKFGRCKSLESFGLPSPSWLTNVTSRRTLSLFKCNHSFHNITSPIGFYNSTCGDYNIYYYTNTTHLIYNNSFPSFPQHNCSFIQLPASDHTGNPNDFFSYLPANFLLQVLINADCVECRHEPHRCLFDFKSQTHYCATEDTGDNGWRRKLKFGLATTSAGLILMVFLCCLMRKFSAFNFIYMWKKPNQAHQNVEAFLKQHGPLPTRRYSYSDVKQMANNFIDKIGQGGCGSIYKGKLKNGRLVAVKVLNKSKGNGEEFINEVATISRTSHVNVVSLLGFCFEGPKRALIYEFLPNGSLEKFIFKENGNQNENLQLDWGTLYQISLGIARGLEYLHRGCSTRILHFDIKPHNILLDRDFTPKISDFGLAKVCTREESIVSMLDARGTVGYIAPEVFCRSFGGVSHKSDVYSYGMMVLEMVGGRKNVNVGVDNTSEIYFPHWIYKRVELDEELGLKRITNEDEKTLVRKMIMVSLWCIQTDPSNRPTMRRVIEMLGGGLDSLEVPPKPYLSSPSRSSSTEISSGFASLQI